MLASTFGAVHVGGHDDRQRVLHVEQLCQAQTHFVVHCSRAAAVLADGVLLYTQQLGECRVVLQAVPRDRVI
ncbi:hypothetical protein [Streptomyces spongiicola]|uniref:hypothetical protein n=1 Tax=Streptomyces spongiicola TaxID=1690221 RepID=UPI0013A586D7|nr:hypothetical protein [Streptomyces spongiicola]